MKTTPNQPDDPWEEALGRAMKRLPDRRAPDTLIPRVRERLDRRAALRVNRLAWSHWPAVLRHAALACSAGLVAAIVTLPAPAPAPVAAFTDRWAGAFESLCSALAVVWDALYLDSLQLALLCAASLLLTMSLTCAGLGFAIYQVVRRDIP